MNRLKKYIQTYLAQRRKTRRITTTLTVLSGILVFITVYTLILPALTLEKDAFCGLEEHEHSKDCYEQVLTCGQEEHIHSKSCYDKEGNIICGMTEHSHDDSCYKEVLSCGKERHVHTEACYQKPEPEEVTKAATQIHDEVVTASKSEATKQGATNHKTTTKTIEADDPGTDSGIDSDIDGAADGTVDTTDLQGITEENAIDLSGLFADSTGIWYQKISKAQEITWEQVGEKTVLDADSLIRVHFAFKLPKAALSSSAGEAVYALPDSISITEETAAWLNDDTNAVNQLILGTSTPDKPSTKEEYLAGKYQLVQDEEDHWQMIVTWDPYALVENTKKAANVWADMYLTGNALLPKKDGSYEIIFAEKTEEHGKTAVAFAGVNAAGKSDAAEDSADVTAATDATTADAADATTGTDTTADAADAKAGTDTKADVADATAGTDISTDAEDDLASSDARDGADTTDGKTTTASGANEDKDTTLTYDGGDYTVTVSYGAEAKLPKDVKLDVREIRENADSKEEKQEFESYFAQASDIMRKENSANVTSARFFDITFINGQKEAEPEAPVSVKIEYKKSEKIGADTDVAAIHLPDNASSEILDVEVNTDKKGVKEVEFTADSFSVYGLVYTVDFEYSVDGEIYYYSMEGGGKIKLSELFHILGIKENVTDVVKVTFSSPKFVKVRRTWFGMGDDWVLESLAPFASEETLTIELKDERKILVKVTDAMAYDGTDYTSVTQDQINLVEFNVDDDGKIGSYNPYTQRYELNVNLEFTIPKNQLITDEGYNKNYDILLGTDIIIPDNMIGHDLTATDNITKTTSFVYRFIKDDAGRYHILMEFDDTYLNNLKSTGRNIGKNKITLEVEINRENINDNNKVRILDEVELDVPIDKIVYPDGTDGKSDISVTKSGGTYDKGTNRLKYTVTVSSNGGTAGTVNITDIISADAGTLPVDSVQIDSVKENVRQVDWSVQEVTMPASAYQVDADGKVLSVTGLPALSANSSYVIEYYYQLDSSVANSQGYEASGNNVVTASTGDITTQASGGWQISKAGVAVGKSGVYNEQDNTITWTITVTNNKSKAITLTDEMLKSVIDGTLKATKDGVEYPISLNADQTLSIPGGGNTYVITYNTPVVSPNPAAASNIANKVTADGKEATGTVGVPAEAKIGKQFISASGDADIQEVTWRVSIDVPRNGLVSGTTFKETMSLETSSPTWGQYPLDAYFTDEQYAAFVEKLGSYLGTEGVDYKVTHQKKGNYADEENPDYKYDHAEEIEIILLKDWDGKAKDNTDYAGGRIIFDYSTTVDTSHVKGKENTLYNKFALNGTTAQASYSFKDKVTKKASEGNSADVTQVTLSDDDDKLHWIIQVHLDRDVDEIKVTDILPEGIKGVTEIAMGDGENKGSKMISLYYDDTLGCWRETREWNEGYVWEYSGLTAITPRATVADNEVTITAKVTEGQERPEYFKEGSDFYFYIEVEMDAEHLPEADANGKISFKNTANVALDDINYGSDDQTQEVTYKMVDKGGESPNWNNDSGRHELDYAIEINPLAQDLTSGNEGVDITLTDSISYAETAYTYGSSGAEAHHVTVSLKENSVKLQRKSGESWIDIPATEGWGYTLDEGTTDANGIKTKVISLFGVPNETALRLVYTYNVEVAGLSRNASVNIGTIKNTATLRASGEWSDSKSDSKEWKNVRSSASTESSGSLTLVKVQKGNYAITLPDTYFLLEAFDPATKSWNGMNAIGYEGVSIDGIDHTLYKTDENGVLNIPADLSTLDKSEGYRSDVLYRVREVKSADGFQLSDQTYENPAGYFFFSNNKDKTALDFYASAEGSTVEAITTAAKAAYPDAETTEKAIRSYMTTEKNYKEYNTARHADNLIYEADTVYLENERIKDTITVEKKWDGSNVWPKDVQSVELTLMKKNSEGDYVDVPDPSWYSSADNTANAAWDAKRTLTKEATTAKWEHLDGTLSDYRVVETAISVNPGPSVLVRTENENGEITWKDSSGNIIYETWGGTVTNGMSTVVNARRTQLKVRKIFQDTTNVSEDIKVYFTLMSRERVYAKDGVLLDAPGAWSEYKTVEGARELVLPTDAAKADDPWAGAFTELEKYRYDDSAGVLYEIQYFATERVEAGSGEDITDNYRVSYDPTITDAQGVSSDQELVVTNQPNLGQLVVHKVWQNKDGSDKTPDGMTEVTINLQRYIMKDGTKVYDDRFNRTNRDKRLKATDTYEYTDPETNEKKTLTWAQLYKGLSVRGTAQMTNLDGSVTYAEGQYVYEVVEDTVTGYITTYSDDVTLTAATKEQQDPDPSQVTVTNTETDSFSRNETMDLHLLKSWYDEDVINYDIPRGATASFRLYRYITTEHGTYDLETKSIIDVTDTTGRVKDIDFNSKDNDKKWTKKVEFGTTEQVDAGEYDSIWEDEDVIALHETWDNIPVEDVYYNNGVYTRYKYEYYAVETASTDDDHTTYVPFYVSSWGKEDKPIGIDPTGIGPEGNDTDDEKVIEVWNIKGDKLRIEKHWYRLPEEYMPPVAVRLVTTYNNKTHQTDGDRNSLARKKSDSTALVNNPDYWYTMSGFSDNGSQVIYVDYNPETKTGGYYVLSEENDWSLVLANVADNTSKNAQFYAYELGYIDAKGNLVEYNDEDESFFKKNHYRFITNDSQRPSESIKWNDIIQYAKEAGSDLDNTVGGSVGTFLIYNIPQYKTGLQITAQKFWRMWNNGSYVDLGGSYTGQLNGQGDEVKITYQLEQRVAQSWNTETLEWTDLSEKDSPWTDYRESFTVDHLKAYVDNMSFEATDQMNTWVTRIRELDLMQYGYMETEEGHVIVRYEYRIKEVGLTPGSDGRTFTKYTISVKSDGQTIDLEAWEKADQERYYMMNLETGVLRIVKEWDLESRQNPDDVKVYFTVKSNSTTMPDVAKKIYEDQDYEYYGLKKENVTFLKEVGEYCIVLSASELNRSSNNWELLLKGLDILDPYNGMGEVNYSVAEVAIEKPVEITNDDGSVETKNQVFAVTDNTYPYNASYYKLSRNDTEEQLAGNTDAGSSSAVLSVGGLQIDSPYSYDDSGNKIANQVTQVRAVNSDKPVTTYTVNKTWPKGTFPDDSMKVVLEIQQRRQKTDTNHNPVYDSDGNPVWTSEWQAAEISNSNVITLPIEGMTGRNAWTYSWKSLPVYKEISGSGTENVEYDYLWYRVIETSSPDWTDSKIISYDGSGNEVAIGNDEYNGQTAYIKPESEVTDPTYRKVLYQQLENRAEKESLTINKSWHDKNWDDSQSPMEWPEGYEIDYKVVRHAYLISVQQKGDTVTYTRGREIPELKMDSLATGTLTKEKQSFTLNGLDKGALYNTGSNPPSGLEADFTYSIEYGYEVVETVIRANGVTYDTKVSANAEANADGSGVTATIVNELTDIKVHKTWDGTEGSQIAVQLYKSSQRPEGKVPVETFKLTVAVPDSNWTTADSNDPADAPEQGQIVVNIIPSEGEVQTLTLENGNWSGTIDLPKTTESLAPITYTVKVANVTGDQIVSATAGATGEVTLENVTGNTAAVNLIAKVPEPIRTFTLNFKDYWVTDGVWNDNNPSSDAPSNNAAWLRLKLTYGSVTEYLRLDSNNEWGEKLNKTLNVKDTNGNLITYNVGYDDNNDNKDGAYVKNGVRNGRITPNSFTGENGDVIVEYTGLKANESSGGGESQEKTTTWSFSTEDGISVYRWGIGDSDKLKIGQSYTLYINSLSGVLQSLADVGVTGAKDVIINKNGWNACSVTFTPESENTPVQIRVYKNEPDGLLIITGQNNNYTGIFEPGSTVTVKFSYTAINEKLTFTADNGAILWEHVGDGGTIPSTQFTYQIPSKGSSIITITGAYGDRNLIVEGQTANAPPITIWDDEDDLFSVSTGIVAPSVAKGLLKVPFKAAAAEKTFTETGTDHLTVTTQEVTDSNGNTVTRSTDRTPYGAEPVGDPIILTSEDEWTHLWSNLPKVDSDGNPIYYYVKEISATVPADTTSITTSYSYQYNDQNDARKGYSEVDITNKPFHEDTYGDLTVNKVVEGLPEGAEAGPFKVTITNQEGKYLTSEGTLTTEETQLDIAAGGSLEFKHLPTGNYTVTESTTDIDNVTIGGNTYVFSSSGSVTTATAGVTVAGGSATITNRYTTSVDFTKTWKENNVASTWPGDTAITVKLTQKAVDTVTGSTEFTVTGKESGTAVISPITNQSLNGVTAKLSGTERNLYTYTVDNLPAYGKVEGETVLYTYTVEETAVTTGGKNVLNTAWEASISGTDITNTYITTDFTVQKRWMHTDGRWLGDDYDASTKTIYYILIRKGDDGKYHQVKADGTPVDSISEVFHLTKDSTAVINLKGNETEGGQTIAKGEHTVHWAHTFTNLPGNKDEYYALECSKNGSKVFMDTGNAFAGKEYVPGTNQIFVTTSTQEYDGCFEYQSNTLEGGSVLALKNDLTARKVKKIWDDGLNDISTHPEVTITLYANVNGKETQVGEVKKITDSTTTKDGDTPYVEWENLPIFDAETGERIIYTATETVANNSYTKTVNYTSADKIAENAKDDEEKDAYLIAYLNLYDESTLKDAPQLSGNDLIFTNKLNMVQIEVEKKWQNADGSGTAPANAAVTLRLSGGDITNRTVVLNGKSDWPDDEPNHSDWGNDWERYHDTRPNDAKAHESGAWKALWKDLPKYDSDGNEITYTITESVGWTGYAIDYTTSQQTTATSVVLTDSGDKKTGTITNIECKEIDLNIEKVDSQDSTKKLDGAVFTLQQIDGNSTVINSLDTFTKQEIATADGGKAKFTKLTNGYYLIEETKTPTNYVRTHDGKIYIQVNNGVVTILSYEADKKPSAWSPKNSWSNDDWYSYNSGSITITAKNVMGVELPHTGGIGTNIITMLGGLITLGAGILIFSRRRMKDA